MGKSLALSPVTPEPLKMRGRGFAIISEGPPALLGNEHAGVLYLQGMIDGDGKTQTFHDEGFSLTPREHSRQNLIAMFVEQGIEVPNVEWIRRARMTQEVFDQLG